MNRKQFVTALACAILMAAFLSGCSGTVQTIERTADASGQLPKTPADALIEAARRSVKEHPDQAKSHITLAAAYLQKVRETGDYTINRTAETSITRARELEPENFSADILEIQIMLSEHRFSEALALADTLEKDHPDNTLVLAAKTDALTELGDYGEAVEAAQKFVDARPNAASYARVAHLRSIYGKTESAIEARKLAVKMADPKDKETYAWYLSRLGNEYLISGRTDDAALAFDKALDVLPEYHWALAGRGKVLAARGDLAGAAAIYEKIVRRVPETTRELYLGDIYTALGQMEKARGMYAAAVKREIGRPGGDLHRIALFWADHGINLDRAAEIARKDLESHKDLVASDTYAWILFKQGSFSAARAQMKDAMRLGSRNALFFYHLGMIENALGNRQAAIANFRRALDTQPSFDLVQAPIARTTLDRLTAGN